MCVLQKFFAREQAELIRDLKAIPRSNRDRKISEFTKRVRAAKTHLILVHHLRRRLPWFNGRWAEVRLPPSFIRASLIVFLPSCFHDVRGGDGDGDGDGDDDDDEMI